VFWKNIFKLKFNNWIGGSAIVFIVLVVLVLLWIFTNGLLFYKSWRAQENYKKINKLYINDKYGGKTPEETYDMLIEALKNNDIDLASKYFVLEKQREWLKTFKEFQKNDSLTNFIIELENNQKIWKKSVKSDDEIVSFTYPVVVNEDKTVEFEGENLIIPSGSYQNETMLIKYPSGVWKIELL
jgi:hypothetical protein